MTLEVRGNYLGVLKFGEEGVSLDPTSIEDFSIIQDINRFLPSFRLKFKDASGFFTHIFPFDRGMSRVSFQLGASIESSLYNLFNFVVYRRDAETGLGLGNNYGVSGLLDVENLFSPDFSRAWRTSLKSVLTDIGLKELKVDSVEVSPGLSLSKLIIQPMWTNAQLLNYLMANLMGASGEGCYFSFIRVAGGKTTLVFKSLKDFVSRPVKYNFVVSDVPYEDNLPIFDYSIMDNYMLHGSFGTYSQRYSYFDYDKSVVVDNKEDYKGFPSLTSYFSIDRKDLDVSIGMDELGRSNEFTSDFRGKVVGSLHKRLVGLSKIWVLTWGLGDVYPGDIVRILFLQSLTKDKLFSYQYSGFWLVERVVHSFGDTFKTRLLLTRNGMDTNLDTSLVVAETFKRF